MSDKTIDEVTPDTNVTGVEKMPVSDNGTAKSVTIEKVKDFVLAKINALEAASDISVASDGVFIKKDGAMKPLSAQTLASAVSDYIFGRESSTSVSSTDVISFKNGATQKTITVANFGNALKSIIQFDAFDIHGRDLQQMIHEDDEIPTCQIEGDVVSDGKKIRVRDIFEYLSSDGASYLMEDVNEPSHLVTADGDKINKMPLSSLPFGHGNTIAPNSNTNNKIPQWNGANSKTLKDGLTLSTNVLSTSTDAEVPTAKAVYDVSATKIAKPATNTANNIPQWSGSNSGALKDGLALVTSVSSSSTDSQIPSAKAVNDVVSGIVIPSNVVKGPDTTTNGKIPSWNSGEGGDNLLLQDGYSVDTSISSSPTDGSLPTSKAVNDAISSVISSNISGPESSVLNSIPLFDSLTGKSLKDSQVSITNNHYWTGISASAREKCVPTVNSIVNYFRYVFRLPIINISSDPASDRELGFTTVWSGIEGGVFKAYLAVVLENQAHNKQWFRVDLTAV